MGESTKKQIINTFKDFSKVGIVVVFVMSLAFFVQLRGDIQALRNQNEVNDVALAETKKTLAAVISGNDELEHRLLIERQLREEAQSAVEENRDEFKQEIVALQSDLLKQRELVESADITKIIEQWSGRVGRVVCRFADGEKTVTARGSAVATVLGDTLHFLTNKHVVTAKKDSGKADQCTVHFGDSIESIVPSGAITISESLDVGYLRPVTSPFQTSIQTLSICKVRPITGDQVVILGYPSVGSQSTVTATEGIISGFDDGYYVTSAKIEQGNSGGAAIHVKNNCFLGIPTLVVVGKIESLARILPL